MFAVCVEMHYAPSFLFTGYVCPVLFKYSQSTLQQATVKKFFNVQCHCNGKRFFVT